MNPWGKQVAGRMAVSMGGVQALWNPRGRSWQLNLIRDSQDPERGPGQGGRPVGLKAAEATVELPHAVVEPHPDAEALAALVIVRPWIGKRLVVRRGVSPAFAALVFRTFGIELSPVDDNLMPRAPGASPVLSYSAGFDSSAASVLLPEAPHLYHLRADHPKFPGDPAYQSLALARMAAAAGAHRRDVRIIRADFEHLVDPYPSLPHWFGFAVGALLMSEELDAGAIALGGTLETWYMDMGRKWTGSPPIGLGIDPLPEMVGMPIMRPTAGLTEITTLRISTESELSGLARSCVRGSGASPCHVCSKCIRKDLIAATVTGQSVGQLDHLDPQGAGWKAIIGGARPLYMQAQFEYCLARYTSPSAALDELRAELAPNPVDTEWLDKAHRPAIGNFVPLRWQHVIQQRIGSLVEWMTPKDEAAMASFDRTTPAAT